jgi:hypothetical protein
LPTEITGKSLNQESGNTIYPGIIETGIKAISNAHNHYMQ